MTLSSHMGTFSICAGTVAGREHTRLFRNNQDAWAAGTSEALAVLVVCDGCSSGARSEVGASLGVQWMADAVIAHDGDIALATLTLLGRLQQLAESSTDYHAFIAHHLLFTLVVAVITNENVRVFGRGDGVVSLNGELIIRDSGEGNAPDYLAYGLLDDSKPPSLDLWLEGEASALQSLVIATDGAVNALDLIAAAATKPVFARNASWLQRQLWALSASSASLVDDATIVLLRKREAA